MCHLAPINAAAPPRLQSALVCHGSLACDSSAASRCLVHPGPASFKDVLLGVRKNGEGRHSDDGDQGWQLVFSKCTRRAAVSSAARDSAPCHDRKARHLAKVRGHCFNCLSPHYLVTACRSPSKCWCCLRLGHISSCHRRPPPQAPSTAPNPWPAYHQRQAPQARVGVSSRSASADSHPLWNLCHPLHPAALSRLSRLLH
jgi:hypothetical protein